jgi:NADP-dependent 3-hydroxy acid dehydrogenase YdfG
MRRDLNGCGALVTGASSGIGRAIAMALAAAGARLMIVGRDVARLEEVTAAAGKASTIAIVGDLVDDADVRHLAARAMRELRAVDVLVHSAGVISLGPFADLPIDALDAQYRVNVRAPFLLTQLLLPAIVESRGQIVFMNSSAGLDARAGVSQYGASKHALKALADSLREEVQGRGVRVISVYPGRTATAMQVRVRAMEGRCYHSAECLQPSSVADAVMTALTMPVSAEIKDISIRPTGIE